MITFEQFKKDWREKEANQGTKQELKNTSVGKHILPSEPLSDVELRDMYNKMQSEAATGVAHHGDIIGGNNGVLTLGDVGH